MSELVNLAILYLGYNHLSGPIPALSALSNLDWLSLIGNQLCLPEDMGLSGLREAVAAALQSLNLPACTGAQPRKRR